MPPLAASFKLLLAKSKTTTRTNRAYFSLVRNSVSLPYLQLTLRGTFNGNANKISSLAAFTSWMCGLSVVSSQPVFDTVIPRFRTLVVGIWLLQDGNDRQAFERYGDARLPVHSFTEKLNCSQVPCQSLSPTSATRWNSNGQG